MSHGLSEYTVAWICALRTEFNAARAFLVEKHTVTRYLLPRGDGNFYALGRIGSHNIVIAAPHDGEYGLSSTAGVIKSLLDSFSNIRISLLVGIGGGAPSRKHHIRLGDVVVGTSNDEEGGVIQYDFGKTMQNQEFHDTGSNQAPALLRTAVTVLQAMRTPGDAMKDRIHETVDSFFHRRSRSRKFFKRPEAASDRLYRTSVMHPAEGGAECSTICGNDPSSLIKRYGRGEDINDTEIHYGLIASANTLMKDASVRDKLIEKKDILCFETEAAGLMNDFPCLVIRGICSYSDSHANEEWQGYAALTAAAYARELLYQLSPTQVEAQQRSSIILG